MTIFMFLSCKSVNKVQKLEHRIFLYHVGVVENFRNNGYIDDDSSLKRSYEFLEDLTSIKGDVEQQYVFFYNPSSKNIKDWKKWFKKNKSKLYWDEKKQMVLCHNY